MLQVGQLVRHHSEIISTIVGWDALGFSALAEGAAGIMAGTANAIAPELVSVHRKLTSGDLAGARAEWERIYVLIDTIMSTNFVPAVKAAVNARGLQVGDPREPLGGEAAARIKAFVAQLSPVRSAV
jgi:4-hydroxy-tetrahydrodipicolinate synthase